MCGALWILNSRLRDAAAETLAADPELDAIEDYDQFLTAFRREFRFETGAAASGQELVKILFQQPGESIRA